MPRCLFLGIQYLVTCNSAWHKSVASCRVDWIIHRCTVGPRSTLLPNPSKDTVVIAVRQNNNMCESGRGGNPMPHTQGTENRVKWNEKHLNEKRGERRSGMDRSKKDQWQMREPELLEKQMSYMRQVNKSLKKNKLWNRESKKWEFITLKNLSKHWEKWKASALICSNSLCVLHWCCQSPSHNKAPKISLPTTHGTCIYTALCLYVCVLASIAVGK